MCQQLIVSLVVKRGKEGKKEIRKEGKKEGKKERKKEGNKERRRHETARVFPLL